MTQEDPPLPPTPVMELDSISLSRRGRKILDEVSLSITEPGRVCGILGANGAGKTSLLKVITGLVRPDGGTVRMQGGVVPHCTMPAQVGALIEEPRFYPWLSGRDNLFVAAGGRSERVAKVDGILAAVGLDDRAADRVRVYSQGMRQRLGIGRALLPDPAILLLDEPANGLDPEGIAWLRSLLVSLRERGTTVVVTSHVLSEVQRTCDMVVVMSAGKAVAGGAMADALADFASLEDLYFSLADRATVQVTNRWLL
jgi:ABC-2 type transport system ATP-binding protein